ncbi:hypothetical protein BH10PSE19_BH10PSE19_00220 [soil metagenome]
MPIIMDKFPYCSKQTDPELRFYLIFSTKNNIKKCALDHYDPIAAAEVFYCSINTSVIEGRRL